MRMPGFTAEACLHNATKEIYREAVRRASLRPLPHVVTQLGFGSFGGGVTYPPDGDDCYCCLQWVRCPCGLG